MSQLAHELSDLVNFKLPRALPCCTKIQDKNGRMGVLSMNLASTETSWGKQTGEVLTRDDLLSTANIATLYTFHLAL